MSEPLDLRKYEPHPVRAFLACGKLGGDLVDERILRIDESFQVEGIGHGDLVRVCGQWEWPFPASSAKDMPVSAIVSAMQNVIEISNLSKSYASGFQALKGISLEIRRGEIFALLGPNGAGKTTLISMICGIVNPTGGSVRVNGHDIISNYRAARAMIGLVPQELTTDAFESVWATVSFSRGLFGKPPNPAHIEKVLKSLSLWDKKDNKLVTLSGGMKRPCADRQGALA